MLVPLRLPGAEFWQNIVPAVVSSPLRRFIRMHKDFLLHQTFIHFLVCFKEWRVSDCKLGLFMPNCMVYQLERSAIEEYLHDAFSLFVIIVRIMASTRYRL